MRDWYNLNLKIGNRTSLYGTIAALCGCYSEKKKQVKFCKKKNRRPEIFIRWAIMSIAFADML